MKKIYVILLAAVILSVNISAWSPFEIYGGQRAGTSSATFLKIGIGARGVALGGAYSALVNDASALYWNPAAISFLDRNSEVFLNHISYVVDIQYNYGCVTHRFGNHVIGLSAGLLSTDDMKIRDEYHPEGTGEYFKYTDAVFGLTYSTQLTNRFSFGLTGKYVQENADIELGRTFLVDLGTLYDTQYKGIKIAVVVSNFGPNLRPDGTYYDEAAEEETDFKDFAPPTIFKLGFSFEPYKTENSNLNLGLELYHPVDAEEKLLVGAEYSLWDMLFLRGGYRFNEDTQNFTAGMGGKMDFYGKRIKLDYALQNFADFDYVHQFSVILNLF